MCSVHVVHVFCFQRKRRAAFMCRPTYFTVPCSGFEAIEVEGCIEYHWHSPVTGFLETTAVSVANNVSAISQAFDARLQQQIFQGSSRAMTEFVLSSSRVGSGRIGLGGFPILTRHFRSVRVGSGGIQTFTGRVGSGHSYPIRPDLT